MDIFTAENYTADREMVTLVLAAFTIYAVMLGNIGRHITCRSSTRKITLQVPFNTVVLRWQNSTLMASLTLAQRHQLCRTSKWMPIRTLNAIPDRCSNRYQPPLLQFLWFHPRLLLPMPLLTLF